MKRACIRASECRGVYMFKRLLVLQDVPPNELQSAKVKLKPGDRVRGKTNGLYGTVNKVTKTDRVLGRWDNNQSFYNIPSELEKIESPTRVRNTNIRRKTSPPYKRTWTGSSNRFSPQQSPQHSSVPGPKRHHKAHPTNRQGHTSRSRTPVHHSPDSHPCSPGSLSTRRTHSRVRPSYLTESRESPERSRVEKMRSQSSRPVVPRSQPKYLSPERREVTPVQSPRYLSEESDGYAGVTKMFNAADAVRVKEFVPRQHAARSTSPRRHATQAHRRSSDYVGVGQSRLQVKGRVIEKFLLSAEELKENEYPSRDAETDGYLITQPPRVATRAQRSPLSICAIDCEMVKTSLPSGLEQFEVARVTIVDSSRRVVYDQLVQPAGKVVDYMTQWSGITKDLLKDVQTDLHQIHLDLILGQSALISSSTVLVGHSIECDLKALRIIHNKILDTAVIYMANRASTTPAIKNKESLKTLSKRILCRDIQSSRTGHDSAEDALASFDLAMRAMIRHMSTTEKAQPSQCNLFNNNHVSSKPDRNQYQPAVRSHIRPPSWLPSSPRYGTVC